MKSLFFDTGPLISFATNNLLWLLDDLKKKYGGQFYIPPSVEKEAVTKPLSTRKFKLEAMQILNKIEQGVIEYYHHDKLRDTTMKLLSLGNRTFYAHGNAIKIVHFTEIEAIAGAILNNAESVIVDEYTTRMLIEKPSKVKERFERKLHTNIKIDQENLNEFTELTKNIKIIRSTELIAIAFELGLLDIYSKTISKKDVLDGALWGLKLNGCAVSSEEIERIKSFESSK